MIKYFKDLLSTLKNIDKNLTKIENHQAELAKCVKQNHLGYGDSKSISIRHWTDRP